VLLPVGRGPLRTEDCRITSQMRGAVSPEARRDARPGGGRKEVGASRRSLLGVAWVDDFTFYRWVWPHPRCAGLAGGCLVCREGLREAQEHDSYWMELCSSLGVPLNLQKRQLCGQTVEYAGFIFDTLRGSVLIMPEKREKLLASIGGLGEALQMTRRELDCVHCRVLHYSACMRHLRILATELGRLAGPVDEASYDRPRPISAELLALAEEMAEVVGRYSEALRGAALATGGVERICLLPTGGS
jgi:hypothetical protein